MVPFANTIDPVGTAAVLLTVALPVGLAYVSRSWWSLVVPALVGMSVGVLALTGTPLVADRPTGLDLAFLAALVPVTSTICAITVSRRTGR